VAIRMPQTRAGRALQCNGGVRARLVVRCRLSWHARKFPYLLQGQEGRLEDVSGTEMIIAT